MKHEDNRAFLDRLMTFSKCGPVMQVFILDALIKSSDAVANKPIDDLREAFKDAFIGADAWHAAACELQTELKRRYES